MNIVATPARHWAGQGPCGGHESTFLGYIIQGNEGGDIYFAGDTARINEDHINKLKNNYPNIRWNFQPGGPDEVRKDMESTHQASVDDSGCILNSCLSESIRIGISKETFLKEASELSTVFMHTMTFKLGNLHLSDTRDSVAKVLDSLENHELTNQTLDKACKSAIAAKTKKLKELEAKKSKASGLKKKMLEKQVKKLNDEKTAIENRKGKAFERVLENSLELKILSIPSL